MDEQTTLQQSNFQQSYSFTINGQFLNHYILALEALSETLDQDARTGLPIFNKNISLLRALINDPNRVKKIDIAMEKERKRRFSPEYTKAHPNETEIEKEYYIGFRVVNGCMRYLIHTFNLKMNTRDTSEASGLLLKHFLKTIDKIRGSLNRTGPEGLIYFNRHVNYLESLITDDMVMEDINRDIRDFKKKYGEELEEQQEFELGFIIVSDCMAYIDDTMKINKLQVKILADQMDANMPDPKIGVAEYD